MVTCDVPKVNKIQLIYSVTSKEKRVAVHYIYNNLNRIQKGMTSQKTTLPSSFSEYHTPLFENIEAFFPLASTNQLTNLQQTCQHQNE
jgi:hypothetical protein